MARVKKYSSEQQHTTRHVRKKKSTATAGDIILFVLIVAAAVALVISYISIVIDPAVFPIPSFFGLYYIPIALINLILLLIAIIRLNKSLFIALIALLPSLFFVELFYKSSNEVREHTGKEIKLITYNVGRFVSGLDGGGYNLYETCSFAESQHPDIVCFQEYAIKDTALLTNYFKDLPYHNYYFFGGGGYFGNVVFSRYPVVNSGRMTFNDSRNLYIWCDLDIDGTTVRLYNCHLESHGISFTSIIKKLGKRDLFAEEMKSAHEKFLKATVRRSDQVNELLTNADSCNYPLIICGDFNDTPMSNIYYRLHQNRKDSFVEGGEGFSATYSYLWPLLRIDYILHSEVIDSDHHRVMKVPYSDHYPVSTSLYIHTKN